MSDPALERAVLVYHGILPMTSAERRELVLAMAEWRGTLVPPEDRGEAWEPPAVEPVQMPPLPQPSGVAVRRSRR